MCILCNENGPVPQKSRIVAARKSSSVLYCGCTTNYIDGVEVSFSACDDAAHQPKRMTRISIADQPAA